ncbi:MAG: MBL fold metallo-hydrolase [Candidatus Aquicultorales bacterium]
MTYYRIRLGVSNCYLVRGVDGYILVDAGGPRKDREIIWTLGIMGIPLEDIKLIVVTHAHIDHVGGLRVMQAACGCPVAVHESEVDVLKSGSALEPVGASLFGKLAVLLMKTMSKRFNPVEPDIIVDDEMQLGEYGVAGRILPVPGHTHGSLVVILGSGEAFVGDLAANIMPISQGPVFPPFAEDKKAVVDGWKRVLDEGATLICPGHGKPFGAGILKRAYDRRAGKR